MQRRVKINKIYVISQVSNCSSQQPNTAQLPAKLEMVFFTTRQCNWAKYNFARTIENETLTYLSKFTCLFHS